jgi:hypothetical protein
LIAINKDETAEIEKIESYYLLTDYRRQKSVDINTPGNLLVKISKFIENNPQIKELDLNRVFGRVGGVISV